MAVSDENKDEQFVPAEYVTFLNRLTDYSRGYTTFESLPPNLQQVFTSLAAGATGQMLLPITGSSFGTFDSATESDKAMLEIICIEVQAALNEDDGSSSSIANAKLSNIAPQLPAPGNVFLRGRNGG